MLFIHKYIGVAVASLSVFPLIGISIPDVTSPVFNADRYIKTLSKIYQKRMHIKTDEIKNPSNQAKAAISKHFYNVKRKQTQCKYDVDE